MKKWILCSVIYFSLLFCANILAAPHASAAIESCPTQLTQESVRIVTNAFVALHQNNDPSAMEKYFSKDYKLFRNNLPPQTYQQLYQETVERKDKSIRILALPFKDVVACGNKVVLRYDFVVDMGNGQTSKGKAIALFEIEDGTIKRTWGLDM